MEEYGERVDYFYYLNKAGIGIVTEGEDRKVGAGTTDGAMGPVPATAAE